MASKLCKLRFLSIKAITLIVLDHQHCLRTYTVFAHGNAQGVYIGYRQVLGVGVYMNVRPESLNTSIYFMDYRHVSQAQGQGQQLS